MEERRFIGGRGEAGRAGQMAAGAGPEQRDLENGSLEITQSLEDEALLDAPLISPPTLCSQLRPKFHAIPVVLVANLLLLLHVAFVVLAFLAAMFCSYPNPNQDKCPGNYTHPFKVQTVIIIAKVILWVLHVFFERYIHHHHSRARSRGYFLIYRSTRHLKRLPLVIHSTGNAALLLILSTQHSFPDHSKVYLYLTLGVLGLELISSLTCLVIYTVRISNFNRAKPRPDIIEEEKVYAFPSHITSEVGFGSNSSLEEIVEKQGDIIEYLQRHNALLSKRLLALTSQRVKS